MAQADKATGHRRIRRDHADEIAEDYVEAIDDVVRTLGSCRVTDLAERFGVSHVTVTRTLSRLVQEGLAETEPYRPVRLTAKGRRLARHARHRHDVVVRFLRAIGVDPEAAEVDAEGMEHHVSPQTLACFETFLKSAANDDLTTE